MNLIRLQLSFNLMIINELLGNKFLKNSIWLFLERGIRLSAAFFISIYVARYLGPKGYGIINYAISFSGLFLALSSLGLDSIVIHKLVSDPDDSDKLLGTTFFLKLFGSLIILIIVAFYSIYVIDDINTRHAVLIISGIYVFHSLNIFDYYFQSKVQSKFVAFSLTAQVIVSSILKLVLVFYQAPFICFPWVWLVDSCVLALGLTYFYQQKNGSLMKLKFHWPTAKKLLVSSSPLILANVGYSIYMKIDQVMITEILGAESNGIYSLSNRLTSVLNFIPAILISTFFPDLIERFNENFQTFLKRAQLLLNYLAFMSFGFALTIGMFADKLIFILAGENYIESGAILQVQIWTFLFICFNVFRSKILVIQNLHKFILVYSLVGAAINVVLNYFLIYNIGLIGAAYATLIAQMIASFLVLAVHRKTFYIFKMQSLAIMNNVTLLFPLRTIKLLITKFKH